MFSAIKRQLSRIPPRAYALWAELELIKFGVTLVVFDLTYHPDALYVARFGDLYTYLALGGLIAAWSVFGVIVTWKRWRKGVKIYLYTLVFLNGIQICFGILHIVLLFTLYRQRLMGKCVSRESDKFFWSSLGYETDEETQLMMRDCLQHWSKFAIQRTLTWAVFSSVLVLATVLINRYHISLVRAYHREIEATGWPDADEKPIVTVMGEGDDGDGSAQEKLMRTPPPGYWEIHGDHNGYHDEQDYFQSHQGSHSLYAEDDAMYRQRDRLYSEISRRRDHQHQQQHLPAGNGSAGPSSPSSPGEHSVHPLDLRRRSMMMATSLAQHQQHQEINDDDDEFQYQPPSPPPSRSKRQSTSSDPIPSSSEKMDYDLFRSQPQRLSVHYGDQSEAITMSRRRNKPQWFQEEHQILLEDDGDDDGIDNNRSDIDLVNNDADDADERDKLAKA